MKLWYNKIAAHPGISTRINGPRARCSMNLKLSARAHVPGIEPGTSGLGRRRSHPRAVHG